MFILAIFLNLKWNMKKNITVLLVLLSLTSISQSKPDAINFPSIKSIKLFQQNNQESMPIINLNSADLLELHFDDLDGYIKSYYYTYQLCNADWSEAELNPFDYIKGFTQNRIIQSRPSSITLSKYVHYQAILPEKNSIPSKSGNYLLKVFLNGDIDNVAFTKRMYVVNNTAAIGMQILQPFDNNIYRTHQKIQFSVNTARLNLFNPNQQIKIALLQNQRWDNAIRNIQPAFMRENTFEYNGEQDCVFPAGKEYRWLDLRSFRFESDRIARKDESKNPIDVYVKPDATRVNQRYLFFKDLNGWYDIVTTDLVNNWWQTGYANVHFTYVPEYNQPYLGEDIYMLGEFTGNDVDKENKMDYNAEKGVYEKTLLLKQGYYAYTYVTKNNKEKNAKTSTEITDGNYWETENTYSLFVYYRSFSGRHDELIGFTTSNSRLGGRLF
jgi:hypothetical protein